MRTLLLAGAGVIALLNGHSNAADLAPIYAPPPPLVAVFTWTGCYIGGNAGGIWANSDWSDTIIGDFGSNTPSGALGGVQAGCNYQAGGFVVGIQGDYDWTSINSSVANVLPLAVLWTYGSDTDQIIGLGYRPRRPGLGSIARLREGRRCMAARQLWFPNLRNARCPHSKPNADRLYGGCRR